MQAMKKMTNELQSLHKSFFRHFQNNLSVGMNENHSGACWQFYLYLFNKPISVVELDKTAMLDGWLTSSEIIEKAGMHLANQVINVLLTKRGHDPVSLEENQNLLVGPK